MAHTNWMASLHNAMEIILFQPSFSCHSFRRAIQFRMLVAWERIFGIFLIFYYYYYDFYKITHRMCAIVIITLNHGTKVFCVSIWNRKILRKDRPKHFIKRSTSIKRPNAEEKSKKSYILLSCRNVKIAAKAEPARRKKKKQKKIVKYRDKDLTFYNIQMIL